MVIEGGHPLQGSVRISGAKNAGLVLIAASIMAEGETILDNVPRICDTEEMVAILNEMGAEVHWREDGSLSICPPGQDMNCQTPNGLSKKLRASNLFLWKSI